MHAALRAASRAAAAGACRRQARRACAAPGAAAAFRRYAGIPREPPTTRSAAWSYDQGASATQDPPAYDAGASQPPSRAPGTKVFADWTVYKSKGAMSVKLIPPTWGALNAGGTSAGNGEVGWSVVRPGRLLLEFAPAVGGDYGSSGGGGGGDRGGGGGARSYRWAEKITVALSPGELGEMFSDPGKSHSFFHDPNMGKAGAQGALTKQLTVAPGTQPGDDGVYFNASATPAGGSRSQVAVRLSPGEYYVLKELGTYAIPHLIGADVVFSSM